MSSTARKHLKVIRSSTVDERLRETFPEIDFSKIVERGTYNEHNLREKWDALVRQVEWWVSIA